MKLILTRRQMEEIMAHVMEELPNEACGLLAGQGGRVEKVYPLPNVERSPHAFRADPEAQFRAMEEMEEKGWDIVGIYHSHPSFPPYPSARDIEMAYYPEAVYLIISLQDPQRPQFRAFSLARGQPEEVEVEVVG